MISRSLTFAIALFAFCELPAVSLAAPKRTPTKPPAAPAPALLESLDDEQAAPLLPAPEARPARKARAPSLSEAAKQSGSWTEWENGHAAWTCEYKNGRRNGKATRFFAEGEGPLFSDSMAEDFEAPFEARATFVDGALLGTCTIVDSHERKLCELELVDDVLEGKTVWYYANGKRRQEVAYRDGCLHGRLEEWSEDGNLVKRHHYLAGRRIRMEVSLHDNGSKLVQGSWYLPCEVVHSVFDWQHGELRSEEVADFAEKVRTGTWTWYFPSGQKQLEGRYVENQPDGTFTWWFENGQKERQGNYAEGKQQGKWSWWYEGGAKRVEGFYAAGESQGVWQYWREDGTRIRDGEQPSTGLAEGVPEANEPVVAEPAPAPKKLDKPTNQTVRRAPTRGMQRR
jgi:antitoxin component YwqK of YwqJK toxin-antitoxin module